MGFPAENSLYAFVHHVRADWVQLIVELSIEVIMLLWHDEDSFAVSCLALLGAGQDSGLNIFPDIWSIVSVEVDDLLIESLIMASINFLLILSIIILILAVHFNGLEICLVSLTSYYIERSMSLDFGVLLCVVLHVLCEDAIVRDLFKLYFELLLHLLLVIE